MNLPSLRPGMISSNLVEDEGELAEMRREQLFKAWQTHFGSLSQEEKKRYEAPEPFDLPKAPVPPSFLTQFVIQFGRYILVARRNISSKIVDTFIIVIAIVLISLFEGVVEVTSEKSKVGIPFDELVSGDPLDLLRNVPQLFGYALSPTRSLQE